MSILCELTHLCLALPPPLSPPTTHMRAGEWTVWALDTVPQVAPGYKFCAGQPLRNYAANTPQVRTSSTTLKHWLALAA